MSGKFMDVKRIVIPTLTLAIIASQLMGCASVSKSELLTLLEQGDNIEIEVASPINQEQGEEQTLDWIQLDQLQTIPELRKEMDDIFKIVPVSNTKNGVFYVDLEGNQNGNNTLYNTFMNNKFRNYWEDESTLSKVADAALNTYIDVDFDGTDPYQGVYMAMNGYFNLLADSTPGYANPDSTLNRLEAMAALFKAEHPVTDTLSVDNEFNQAVDSSNSNPNTIYASNLSEQSFLDIDSGSLDNMTANGTITRGEFVYMLVQQYFKAEYDSVDLKAECFSDTINGGDIASKQKFIEDGTAKKYWQSYELTYAIQNPDKGCPERMYKALVVAFDKEIITDSNSRWDEALTKSDFMELLTNAYSALPTVTNADRGAMEELAQQIANYPEDGQLPGFEEGEYTEADNEPVVDIEIDAEINASILEDYKAMYERGEISKETYEFMVDFNEEADNFIKENGSTSTAEVDNSMNQGSSNTVTIPDELLEGAVTKPAGEGDGSGYVEHGSGDYTGLEKYSSN